MIVRPEIASDVDAIRAVTDAAFGDNSVEAKLVDGLRNSDAWLPHLSLVTEVDGAEVGHVLCSRGTIDGFMTIGLAPLSVHPDHQKRGMGTALMVAAIATADALREPFVAVLGDTAYYSRFGFRPATDFNIDAPDPSWGEHFMVRALSAYDGEQGTFRYAPAFDDL